MTRHVAALALPVLLAGVLCAAPDGAPAPGGKVAALIAQLGDPDFARREAASKELEAAGPTALAALEKAARESDDMEVARRAAAVARKLARHAANDRTLAPTVVELSADDTPVDAVLADLSKQTGYVVALGGPKADDAAARAIKVKTGRVPFWEAVGQVCEAADLQIASVSGVTAPGSTATTPAPRRPQPAPAPQPGARAPAPADPFAAAADPAVAALHAEVARIAKERVELMNRLKPGDDAGKRVLAELAARQKEVEAKAVAQLQQVVQDKPAAQPAPPPAAPVPGRIAPAIAAARLQAAAPPPVPAVPGGEAQQRAQLAAQVMALQLQQASRAHEDAAAEESRARLAVLDALARSAKKGATEAEKKAAAERVEKATATAADAKAKLAAARAEVVRVQAQLAAAQAEARRLPAPGAAPFNPANAVILEPRRGGRRPAAVHGAVRVEAAPVPAGGGAPNAVTAVLLVWPEPKLVWQQTKGVRVTRAADDHGQALAPDLVSGDAAEQMVGQQQVINNGNVRIIRNPNGQVIVINNGNVQVGGEIPQGVFLANNRQAVVRLKPGEKATDKLAELAGSVEAGVRCAAEALVSVADLTKPGEAESTAGVAVKTTALKKDGAGWTLEVTLRYDARAVTPSAPGEKATAAAGATEEVFMAGAGGLVRVNRVVSGRVSATAGNHTYNGLRVTDEKGRPFAFGTMNAQHLFNGANATEMRFTFNLRKTAADQGEPKELKFWGTRGVTVEVPFALKDVPAVTAKK